MKYKIILKTTHKHKNRIQNCADTWLKNTDVICITDKILADINIPQISGSDKDTHGVSSEEKTVFIFNYIKNNPDLFDVDWFLFIDDDAVLNTKYLEYILSYLDNNIIYGINMKGSYPLDKTLAFPSGGGGYLVSKTIIVNTPSMVNHHYHHEDVNVGRYARDNNIIIDQHLWFGGLKHKIAFNGWFPFDKQGLGIVSDSDIDMIIERNNLISLQDRLTHHYIRNRKLMSYITDMFNEWTPSISFPIDDSIFKDFNTDKNTRHSYGKLYKELLDHTVFKTYNLLELGVKFGGSCSAFNNYKKTLNVFGVDRSPCIDSKYRNDFNLIKGGLFYEKTIKEIKQRQYDIIIDDMSHVISDIVTAFNLLKDNLSDNGVYIIEDIHEPRFMVNTFLDLAQHEKFNVYIVDLRLYKKRFDDFLIILTKKPNFLILPSTPLSLMTDHI